MNHVEIEKIDNGYIVKDKTDKFENVIPRKEYVHDFGALIIKLISIFNEGSKFAISIERLKEGE